MMRFVDLGTQLDALDEKDGGVRAFAFFDTITSSFVNLDGEQTWPSWEEFEEAWNLWIKPHAPDIGLLNRFRKLCPPWVFSKALTDFSGLSR